MLALVVLLACSSSPEAPAESPDAPVRPATTAATAPPTGYDPLALVNAQAKPEIFKDGNREASVPTMCYTKTAGTSNPCWVCHTKGNPPVHWDDRNLQLTYAFSDTALTNQWHNLFEDRTEAVAQITDEEIEGYIRVDNYTPLREAMAQQERYPGYRPDSRLPAGIR